MRGKLHLIAVGSIIGSALAIPTPYPSYLNSTVPSGFEIRVASANPRLKNRNVQLIDNPSDSAAPQLAGIDPWSPVAPLQLRNGVLYSENRTEGGQLYNLGPVLYLRNTTTTNSTSLAEVYFANQTQGTPPTADFELVNVSNDAEYNLYHRITATGIINGFCACELNGSYQLFYYTYTGKIPNFGANCDYVAIQVDPSPLQLIKRLMTPSADNCGTIDNAYVSTQQDEVALGGSSLIEVRNTGEAEP
jgi:hypothetical protein